MAGTYKRMCGRGHSHLEDEIWCYQGGPKLMIDGECVADDIASESERNCEDVGRSEQAVAKPSPVPCREIPEHQGNNQNPVRRSKVFIDTAFLYLEIQGNPGKQVIVRPHQVVGRADEPHDDRAEIPWVDEVDMGFVSRWHCRFELEGVQWFVLPEHNQQSELPAPNPTYVNGHFVEPKSRHVVNDGDQVRLSDLVLNVRILSRVSRDR